MTARPLRHAALPRDTSPVARGRRTPILPRIAGEVDRRGHATRRRGRSPRQSHPTFTPVIEIAANTSSVKKLTGSPGVWAPST